MSRLCSLRLTGFLVFLLSANAHATSYFVDGEAGDDGASGTSEATAWRSLAKVNAAAFAPGDVVSFRRGGTYSGRLQIHQSGTEAARIVFTAYGTGEPPVFENPASGPWDDLISLEGASYVTIENLLLRTTRVAGVAIKMGSDHNIVSDCEITDAGFGVTAAGSFNLVTGNYIHDLKMVVNTQGGNDDFGATAVGLFGSDNEVSYNRFVRCEQPSFDYGTDGGAIEFYGTASRCRVHHNYAEETEGFVEVGGQAGDQNYDNVLFYNVAFNTKDFGWYHDSGTFAVDLQRFRVEQNTIVILEDASAVFGFDAAPSPGMLSVRNNLVVTVGSIATQPGFTHDHNLFWRADGSALDLTLDATDLGVDPRFVDQRGGDFHLQSGSPAIDKGADLGYATDFDGRVVPPGAAPDLGAFEYEAMPRDADAGGGGVDAGGPRADAGTSADGGLGHEGADASCDVGSRSGCGCRVGGRGGRGPSTRLALGLGLLFTVVLRVRRRRG